VTSQIQELAYNAVAGAAHRYGNGCSRRVPRIGNRVILPSLISFTEARIEPAGDVDFAVTRIVSCAREIAAIGHRRGGCPTVCSDIVNIGGVKDTGVHIQAAENINLVDIGRVGRARIKQCRRQCSQGGPRVRDRIVSVDTVRGHEVRTAASRISECAIAGNSS
jgi:hypothetical protein